MLRLSWGEGMFQRSAPTTPRKGSSPPPYSNTSRTADGGCPRSRRACGNEGRGAWWSSGCPRARRGGGDWATGGSRATPLLSPRPSPALWPGRRPAGGSASLRRRAQQRGAGGRYRPRPPLGRRAGAAAQRTRPARLRRYRTARRSCGRWAPWANGSARYTGRRSAQPSARPRLQL